MSGTPGTYESRLHWQPEPYPGHSGTLHAAARARNARALSVALATLVGDVRASDASGSLPLHLASSAVEFLPLDEVQDPQCVQLLLAADPGTVNGPWRVVGGVADPVCV
jgi:hypothetical protein